MYFTGPASTFELNKIIIEHDKIISYGSAHEIKMQLNLVLYYYLLIHSPHSAKSLCESLRLIEQLLNNIANVYYVLNKFNTY